MSAPRKIRALINNINDHGFGVRTFTLKPERSLTNKFNPGQFLHLAIDHYDPSFNWPESRVFSIATSPTRADNIEVIISKKGHYTERIFSELKEGSEVWIKLPYGTFNFNESFGRKTFLIAGGTGITPFISYLQFLLDSKIDNNLSLHYGIRNEKLIIIDELLMEYKNRLSKINISLYIEEGFTSKNIFNPIKGIISIEKIINEAKECIDPVFYLAGPQEMVKVFQSELKKNNFSQDIIFYDKWE